MSIVRCSAIIVNFFGDAHLIRCLEAVAGEGVCDQVLVVDNGSSPAEMKRVRLRFPSVEIITPQVNLGFASGANLGAASAEGEVLVFLNPDTILRPGSLQAMMEFLSAEEDVGICGPVLTQGASGVVEYGATVDWLGNPLGLTHPGNEPLYIPGCALAVKTGVFACLGGFDERFFMFVEDVDLCWRALLRGYGVKVCHSAAASHVGGQSAPGGYPSGARLQTSGFRLELRHRNTLWLLLKCQSPMMLVLTVPAFLIQVMLVSAWLIATRQVRGAVRTLYGLTNGLLQLRATLRLRREVQRGRVSRHRDIRMRLYRGARLFTLWCEVGTPVVEHSSRSSDPTIRN